MWYCEALLQTQGNLPSFACNDLFRFGKKKAAGHV
jgi:hypothetical protein